MQPPRVLLLMELAETRTGNEIKWSRDIILGEKMKILPFNHS
jgi:hypothetical protein